MRLYLLAISSYWLLVGACRTPQKSIHNVSIDGSDVERDWIERAARLGFVASEHTVQTEDGYVLRVFRMRGVDTKVGRPVLLMHGLLQSADAWLDAGSASLAVLLAASGRDLWLGNARGSHHSRQHAWLRPDTDALYWRFSADEIGRYDLPALLDYILAATGDTKLDYIGFSQGGGIFFIMCSERPDYCGMVNLVIALAPAARIKGMKSIARIAFGYFEEAEKKLTNRGIWEILPRGGLIQSLSETLCKLPKYGLYVCDIIKSLYDGPHPGSVTSTTFLEAAAGFPAGTSVHNLARYSQNIRSGNFQKFDYGPEQNLVLYGSETAPVYNLSAVTVPTLLIYGKNDRLVDFSNIKWLIKKLPNVEAFQVKNPMWSHMDFTMSKYIPVFVYPMIRKYLDKYS